MVRECDVLMLWRSRYGDALDLPADTIVNGVRYWSLRTLAVAMRKRGYAICQTCGCRLNRFRPRYESAFAHAKPEKRHGSLADRARSQVGRGSVCSRECWKFLVNEVVKTVEAKQWLDRDLAAGKMLCRQRTKQQSNPSAT